MHESTRKLLDVILDSAARGGVDQVFLDLPLDESEAATIRMQSDGSWHELIPPPRTVAEALFESLVTLLDGEGTVTGSDEEPVWVIRRSADSQILLSREGEDGEG